jgi:hypothetical protein
MALIVLIVMMRKQRGPVKAARLRRVTRVSFGGALLTWSTSIIQNLTANSIYEIPDMFRVISEVSRNFKILSEHFAFLMFLQDG